MRKLRRDRNRGDFVRHHVEVTGNAVVLVRLSAVCGRIEKRSALNPEEQGRKDDLDRQG